MSNSSNLYSLGTGTVSSSSFPGNAVVFSKSPTVYDIKGSNGQFPIGQLWINQDLSASYQLVSFSSSNGTVLANWIPLASASGALNTLSGNTGVATPSGGNIQIRGSDLYDVTASGDVLTISPLSNAYPLTPYVVGPVGQAGYQTIQSALDAANAAGGGNVAIQRGTYVENLTLYANVSMFGVDANVDSGGIFIQGQHTPPLTGQMACQQINFTNDSAPMFYSTDAGTSYIEFSICNFILTGTPGYVFYMPNWGAPGVIAINDAGDISTTDSGTFYVLGDAQINCLNSFVGNFGGGGTIPMISGGQVIYSLCDVYCPTEISGSQTLQYMNHCSFHGNTGITVSGSTSGNISNCNFVGLTDSAFTMSSSGDWSIGSTFIDTSNDPAIDGSGSGTLTLSGVDFADNSTVAATLTLDLGASSFSGTMRAGTDAGGTVGTTSLTSTNSTTISSGAGSIKMSSANPADNAAWIKIYIGTTAYWIPAWTTNAP